jgi:hypothetical protein
MQACACEREEHSTSQRREASLSLRGREGRQGAEHPSSPLARIEARLPSLLCISRPTTSKET